jgi:hypothetical protein
MSQFSKYLEIVQEGKDYNYNESFNEAFYKKELESLKPYSSELKINDEWSIEKNANNYKNSSEKKGGFSLYSQDASGRHLYFDDLTLITALETIKKILSGKEIN